MLVVSLATGAQGLLSPFLPSPQQFLFAYPAVVAAAWLAGLGPGILASCLAAVVIAYFFLPPSFSFAVTSTRDQLDLAIFVAFSVLVVLILDRLEKAIRARDRALRAAEDASARLSEQQALLAAVIEHAPVGLAFATRDGEIRLGNGSWRAIVERGGGRVVPAQEWQRLLVRAQNDLVDFEAQVPGRGDSTLWISGRLAPVRAARDEPPIGLVSVLHDVSAEHRIDELREEFVAIITHDLRSPISTIPLGLQGMLRRRALAGGAETVTVPAAAVERMHRSVERLGTMVNELLDASGVELRNLKLDRKDVDICRFVADLVEDVRPSLRGHEVVTELPPRPVAASVDPGRMAQVLTNLLDNASKYSRPASPIRVSVREASGSAEVTVTDEGEGISPLDVPRLFDRFFQARRAREQRTGLGLGLYITKGIVDAHGGHLFVDSTRDVGSAFHVSLPLARADVHRAARTS